MSKLNQIQMKLLQLDGGAFQKLGDSYLSRKGYEPVYTIGSVIGSNKTQVGTPDTLIATESGKYIFVEYTTIREKQVKQKFRDDIAKCLDESKTNISVDKIKEIILCYNRQMSVEDVNELRQIGADFNVIISVFINSSISLELLEKYPSVAKDHLGVDVDTGQIVSLSDFKSLHEKNELTISLSTKFYFREQEKNLILESMENNRITLISGKSGIGKSRLAIECYESFSKDHADYKPFCIFNKSVNIYDDIRAYFSDSGNYLIFVDDANRVSGFQYIIDLLMSEREDQRFKIIVTVRDYALEKVLSTCNKISTVQEISINPFSNDEIKKILKNEFNIDNPEYLERISRISQGNPRVAVMAAEVAVKEDTLASINDVSAIYDAYFSSMKNDLLDLENNDVLKTAGIVAFMGSIDKTSKEHDRIVTEVFGFSIDKFWDSVITLHNMECVDVFEHEVVKVSDQILSTYLLYLVFFKRNILDYSVILKQLFPSHKRRIIDSLYPVLDAFDYKSVKDKIVESVTEVWEKCLEDINKLEEFMRVFWFLKRAETLLYVREQIENEEITVESVTEVWEKCLAEDINKFEEFMRVFWFLKPTETLLYVREQIENEEITEVSIEEIGFQQNKKDNLPSYVHVLSDFRNWEAESPMSIDLLMSFAEKRQDCANDILHMLVGDYGFQARSDLYLYSTELDVAKKLISKCKGGDNLYFSKLFLLYAEQVLKTKFNQYSQSDRTTITITNFELNESAEIREFRNLIYEFVFVLLNKSEFKEHVKQFFVQHFNYWDELSKPEIVEKDAKSVLPQLSSNLDRESIIDCVVVNAYKNLLKRCSIDFDPDLVKQYQTTNYKVFDLFTNRFEQREMELSEQEYREYKKNKADKIVESLSVEDCLNIFRDFQQILDVCGNQHRYLLGEGIYSLLESMSAHDSDKFAEVIQKYLKSGDYLKLDPMVPVKCLIQELGRDHALNTLLASKYPSQSTWLLYYYAQVPENEIEPLDLEKLKEVYETAEPNYLISQMDYLLKYESKASGFIANICRIVLERSKKESEFNFTFKFLLNSFTEINKQILELFKQDISLLEEVYLDIVISRSSSDYNGGTLSKIIDVDPAFIIKYIDTRYESKKYFSKYDDQTDYSFIWLRSDHIKLMEKISEKVHEWEKRRYVQGYLEKFFSKNVHPQKDVNILEKQDDFLEREILKKNVNSGYMKFLFLVIAGFDRQRSIRLFKLFLENNKNFSDFKKLPIFPTSSSWSGSAVPMYQERLEYTESLIELCNGVDLLPHRQHLEKIASGIREKILHYRKKDFTED